MKTILSTVLFILLSGATIAQHDFHSKYLIKISPTQIYGDEIYLEYEQRVGKQISFTVNAGPTIQSQHELLHAIHKEFYKNIYDQYNGRPLLGYYVGAGFRYYPVRQFATALNGFYLEPEFKYRETNSEINHVNPSTQLYQVNYLKRSQFFIRLEMGYQCRFNKNFALEFFGTIGFSITSFNTKYHYVPYPPNNYDKNYYLPSVGTGTRVGVGGTKKSNN